LIIWKSIEKELLDERLAVIHREGIDSEIYPDKAFFRMDDAYAFTDKWDWSVLPCNTAFLYMADGCFKDNYTSEAIRFMKNLRDRGDTTAEMVFAEQRVLTMCANEKNIPIKSLLDVRKLDSQTAFTHVWGYKTFLSKNQAARHDFCKKCLNRLMNDFPEEQETLERIDFLKPYFMEDAALRSL
jgi:hypothetical protein